MQEQNSCEPVATSPTKITPLFLNLMVKDANLVKTKASTVKILVVSNLGYNSRY